MRNSVLPLLLAGSVMFAGCGGGGGNVSPESSPPMAQPQPQPEPETQRSRFDPVNGLAINEAFIEGFIAAIGGPVDYHDTRQELKRWRRTR